VNAEHECADLMMEGVDGVECALYEGREALIVGFDVEDGSRQL
jgi:hypothetical protein